MSCAFMKKILTPYGPLTYGAITYYGDVYTILFILQRVLYKNEFLGTSIKLKLSQDFLPRLHKSPAGS